ncbi:MAG: carbamoyltransferase N-terminal domain-containing protein [Chloroflexota bacterium]|nr:carbamoyltransferase N-terminal domain-containing protein [Chloroflexota bacterium]
MIILGISCYFHDSAAALLVDGKLVAAAEEERFTRNKHDYDFPHNAVQFCLNKGNITGADLDYAVLFEKPFTKFERIIQTALHGFPKTYWMFVQSMRTWLLDKLWVKDVIAKSAGIPRDKVLFSEHHLSHAASSYFCSPFEESAVLTFDGVGEWSTTTMGVGHGNDLHLTKELHFPHSIGLLYSAFTAFLGFEVNEGEYKVMGMAPYGSPKYTDKVQEVVKSNADGSYWLNPKYFSLHYSTKKSYTKHFEKLFGEPRDPDVPFFTAATDYPSYYGPRPENFSELANYNQHYADIAASIQSVTEDLILELVRESHRQTGLDQLCLAGGVALNSVANGRILRETPFKELYIQPSAGDGGGALGAALFTWHCALGNSERFVMDHAYWGEEYTDDEVKSAIEAFGLTGIYMDDPDKLVDLTVESLLNNETIGWFQGKFEWGPRALGNRSILADPRSSKTKDIVNNKIKFREPFRPFAPSVLAECAEQYFDLPNPELHLPARFMQLVVPVLEDKQSIIPAVSHEGTARVQTVDLDSNPLYYKLIHRFGEATGVPILLNTSFNVRGEPIVSSPEDALNTFINSGLDMLAIGNYIVRK